jgi:hypothetical protein
MDFIHTNFNNLLEKHDIKSVVYFLSTPTTIDSSTQKIMPLGLINLCCYQKSIGTLNKSTSNMGWRKLGFSSKKSLKDIIKTVDEKHKDKMRYKNEDMRKTILIGELGIIDGI